MATREEYENLLWLDGKLADILSEDLDRSTWQPASKRARKRLEDLQQRVWDRMDTAIEEMVNHATGVQG